MTEDNHDVPTPDVTSAPRAVRRRTLARGAVWTAPIVAASVPAPAFAASATGTLELSWTAATYLPLTAEGRWQLTFSYANTSTVETFAVTRFEVVTSYHTPAANTQPDQVVLTVTNPHPQPLPVLAPGTSTSQTRLTIWSKPPVDGGGSSIWSDYYCGQACTRLAADDTAIVITFTSGAGGTQSVELPFSAGPACAQSTDFC